jgi:hypothetical protein
MTTYEILMLVVTGAGSVALVGSIVFLISEARSISENSKDQVHQAMVREMLSADRLFVTHPQLRPYFYDGVLIAPGDPDYDRACAVAEYLLDYLEAYIVRKDRFREIWHSDWWDKYLHDSFRMSPLLCDYLRRCEAWYAPALIKIMNEAESARKSASSTTEDRADEELVVLFEVDESR